MTLITCKVCQLEVRRKVPGQRFCTAKCRQAHFRQRTAKKRADGVTHKRRLYGGTATRYESAEKTNENRGDFEPPTYCFYNIGYGTANKPLSNVEIAALGGYVANIRAKPRPDFVGGDSQ